MKQLRNVETYLKLSIAAQGPASTWLIPPFVVQLRRWISEVLRTMVEKLTPQLAFKKS